MISRRALAIDSRHIIHPYASPIGQSGSLPIHSSKGVYLHTADKPLIDGMSSWWSAIHGYNNPQLIAAINKQLNQLAHVMFGGITHQPACQLSEQLLALTPHNLNKIFFADSGSVAVEVALKSALQYWQAQGLPKTKFLALECGYHGDTFGAMSVTDPINSLHSHFRGFIQHNYFAPAPALLNTKQLASNQDIQALEAILTAHHQAIAAVIVEPIVQGAGGMRFYRADYLKQLKSLCYRYQVLLIFDEIATGFGRTGKWFALEHAQITPHILCLGKALTGGMMTLAACLLDESVAQTIASGKPGLLMHGPTYMANPLACVAASASIQLLHNTAWQQAVTDIQQALEKGLHPLQDHPCVHHVRVFGAIGVVELKQPVDNQAILPILLDSGVWLRPFGKLLYTMPPFICQTEHIQAICQAIRQICDFLSEG